MNTAINSMRCLTMILLLIPVSAAVTQPAQAAPIVAASCSQTDVGNAVASAAHGDTVSIPGGTCSWTTTLAITKGITLIGAGVGSTVLKDNVSKGDASCRGGGPIMSWTVSAPNTFRISALTIQGIATDPNVCNSGHITLGGSTTTFQVDHIAFTSQQVVAIRVSGSLYGVISQSTFSGNYKQGIVVSHATWAGGINYGDGSWTDQIYWGMEKAVYIEDCGFTELSTNQSAGAIDAFDGARIVFRYNTLHNQNGTSHGADSHQRGRGSRQLEIYNNTYTFDSDHAVAYVQWIRGGTGVVFNNTITTVFGPNSVVQASNCRDGSAGCGGGPSYTPWGACNGTSSYDQNSFGGYRCVDQPGSGTSNVISAATPSPVAWVGNALDPIYVWNNTVNGSSRNTVSGSTNVQNNRDYFIGMPRPGYVPYTYPHPRRTGATLSALNSPTNLRALP